MPRVPNSQSHHVPFLRHGWVKTVALTLLGSVLFTHAPLAFTAPAHAVSSPSSPHQSGKGEAPASPQPTLTVAPGQPVWDPASSQFTVTAFLRNPSDAEFSAGTLRLWFDPQRKNSQPELESALNPPIGSTPPNGTLVAEQHIGGTAANDQQALSINVPAESLPVTTRSDSGVYVLRAEITPDTEDADSDLSPAPVTAYTSVVWRTAPGKSKLPFTTVVPLLLPPEVDGMPTPGDLAEAVPGWDKLLELAINWKSTIAIDPRVIVSIRAYGDVSPAAAREFLTRLEATPNTQFLLQTADADPAAQAALGLRELLQPTGFSYLTSQGGFPPPAGSRPGSEPESGSNPANSSPGSATPGKPGEPDTSDDRGDTADSGQDELSNEPDLAALTAWSGDAGVAWPAPGQADGKTLRLVQQSGLGGVVLDSRNLQSGKAGRHTVGGLNALVSNAALDQAAASALSTSNETERAAHMATLASQLSLTTGTTERSGTVLSLDRAALAQAADPAELFNSLAKMTWLAPTPQNELPLSADALRQGSVGKHRVQLLRDAQKRSIEIDKLAPLLAQPAYLTEYQRVQLLQDFTTSLSGATVDIVTVDQAKQKRDAQLLSGVRVIPNKSTQLLGASSRVPVLIHNALPFEAVVALIVMPNSASITVPERRFPEQRIAAGANLSVLVPVDSRVSSGESRLAVRVTDSTAGETFSTALIPLTIRSSYEAIMLGVLGVLAALLLGFGVWRSLRRHRPRNTESENSAENQPKTSEVALFSKSVE